MRDRRAGPAGPQVIWCDVPFPPGCPGRQLLVEGTAAHTLLLVDRTTPPAQARAWLDGADVAFGHPPVEALLNGTRLAWLAVAAAGYEAYDRDDLLAVLARRRVPMTNAGSVYSEACAQHALAMMLGAVRALPACAEAQRQETWAFATLRPRVATLAGQRVLLLGWGRIARHLAALLAPLRAEVRAVRRVPDGREGVPIVPLDALEAALPATDHLVNLLPGGARTRHFVGGARLRQLRRGAWFYNIGRGSTVDHDALAAALGSGHLAGAWLDVTDPEPLPAGHPLWRTPGCHITPHLAGGHVDEKPNQVRHFLDNLARFTAGTSLIDRVW